MFDGEKLYYVTFNQLNKVVFFSNVNKNINNLIHYCNNNRKKIVGIKIILNS